MKNLKENLLYQPISSSFPTTFYLFGIGDETLNVKPILDMLTGHDKESVVSHLDEIIGDMIIFYMEGAGRDNLTDSTYNLMLLRELRNAFMAGFGIFDINEFVGKKRSNLT